MKKTIHVHVHRPAAATRDADSGEGRWVTINGTHVQIKDGKITAGPKGTVGKGVSEGFDHLANKKDKKFKQHKGHDVTVPGGPEGTVHVTVRPGSNVRGAHHYQESSYHMSTGLAAMHAERGDVMHYSETHKGKYDAHTKKAAEHREAAEAHPDTAGKSAHNAAAAAHDKAAAHHHLHDGSDRADRSSAEAHLASQAVAQGKQPHDASKPHVTTVKPMPGSHMKLHEQADRDVKGSRKHEEEHNRLQNMYHASQADWERSAINRRIEHNAVAARQSKVDSLHETALKASERAHKDGTVAQHAIALQHINSAITAHASGGVGYAAKQAELRKLAKGHDDAVTKANKAYMEQRRAGKGHEEADAATAGKPAIPQGTRVKFSRGLTGEEVEGVYNGMDEKGRALVTSQGRVHALDPSKVQAPAAAKKTKK